MCFAEFMRMLPGTLDVRIIRQSGDYSFIEYTYIARSGEQKRERVPVNNTPNQDGSVLYRNPHDIVFGGPITLDAAALLEKKCRVIGYDITQ